MNTQGQFPNNLRMIRKRLGLRQVDVADRLGRTSADCISHWEKGLALPSVVNLFKLAIIYGVPLDHLYPDLYDMLSREMEQRRMRGPIGWTSSV